MAQYLARVHRINPANADLSFLPQQEKIYADKFRAVYSPQRTGHPDESLQESRIRAVLESAFPLTPRNPPALLHGDFWQGNVLCREEQIAAVIDWEDARVGDPLEDLGNTRLETLWAFGEDAMNQFTRAYRHSNPTLDYTDLPYWDLAAALRPANKLDTWSLEPATVTRMRTLHARFVNYAIAKL
jgi:aminoglycoside phosphotransferase (APT) family kinase protein